MLIALATLFARSPREADPCPQLPVHHPRGRQTATRVGQQNFVPFHRDGHRRCCDDLHLSGTGRAAGQGPLGWRQGRVERARQRVITGPGSPIGARGPFVAARKRAPLRRSVAMVEWDSSIGFYLGGCHRRAPLKVRKPAWWNTRRYSTTPAYSLTSPPARPGCPLSIRPCAIRQRSLRRQRRMLMSFAGAQACAAHGCRRPSLAGLRLVRHDKDAGVLRCAPQACAARSRTLIELFDDFPSRIHQGQLSIHSNSTNYLVVRHGLGKAMAFWCCARV